MSYCSDCGCKISGGVCSNCQEELYIVENQIEYITEPLSDEFANEVQKQVKYLRDKRNV
jgi:hypothetical protein